MHQTVQNLLNIKSQIKSKINELKYNNYYPKIIAVSKTFPISHHASDDTTKLTVSQASISMLFWVY
tara:strand:+ start:629 stop:826 length:198 start_codon:yes stop_codon:yes gene_type:complete